MVTMATTFWIIEIWPMDLEKALTRQTMTTIIEEKDKQEKLNRTQNLYQRQTLQFWLQPSLMIQRITFGLMLNQTMQQSFKQR